MIDPDSVNVPGDPVDDFMSAVAEWVALTAYRLAHSPLQPTVPPDELECYCRAKRALREALSESGRAWR
jgi:hypothetical protein